MSSSGALVDPDAAAPHIIAFNLLAIADHARTLASVLDQASLGPSAPTLARACLESLARIRWLAKAKDADDMRSRVLGMLDADVSKGARSARFASEHGVLTRDEYLDATSSALKKLGKETKMADWSIAKAIREVVTEAWGDSADWGSDGAFDAWTPYSQLSSFAHGTLPGLGSLVDPSTKELRLPNHEVINGIGIVYGVADKTFRGLERCPLPVFEPDAIEEVWGTISRALEPDRIRLGDADHAELV